MSHDSDILRRHISHSNPALQLPPFRSPSTSQHFKMSYSVNHQTLNAHLSTQISSLQSQITFIDDQLTAQKKQIQDLESNANAQLQAHRKQIQDLESNAVAQHTLQSDRIQKLEADTNTIYLTRTNEELIRQNEYLKLREEYLKAEVEALKKAATLKKVEDVEKEKEARVLKEVEQNVCRGSDKSEHSLEGDFESI